VTKRSKGGSWLELLDAPGEEWQPQLATMFAGFLAIGRPVVNRTALDGRFDFHIPFEPGFVFGPNPGTPLVPAADSGPNFFTAIQEQLGLKLQSERAPVDFVVIDHAERPTEN